jgi:hypothetical protein
MTNKEIDKVYLLWEKDEYGDKCNLDKIFLNKCDAKIYLKPRFYLILEEVELSELSKYDKELYNITKEREQNDT